MGKDKNQDISGELANAFKPEKKSKLKPASIAILVIGVIVLIVGIVVLILNLSKGPALSDAEKLTSAKEWILDANCGSSSDAASSVETGEASNDEGITGGEANCSGAVVWKFTEVGKGNLTTNGHKNDYDFKWAIEEDKLRIEVEWLYDLDKDYGYKFEDNDSTLVLTDKDDKEYRFVKTEKTEK